MKLEKQDKMLAFIAVGFGLYVVGNIWGGVFLETITEIFKHIFL